MRCPECDEKIKTVFWKPSGKNGLVALNYRYCHKCVKLWKIDIKPYLG